MKIIVAGCGNVGATVVKNLAREGHEITAIDVDADRLEEIVDYYDANGINGNAALLSTLESAEANKADLFIAAMSSDEVNILCCNLAKFSGAKATAARLRNPDYAEQADVMRKALGLDYSVNPELELAKEISRKLRFPAVDNVDEIVGGKAVLITLTLPTPCALDGKKIMEINEVSKTQGLICAVERGGEVTIPKGGFVIRAGDRISFAATPKNVDIFLKDMNMFRPIPKKVVIMGLSPTTFYLADELIKTNMSVKVILSDNDDRAKATELPKTVAVVHGKATEQEVFEEEGLAKADAIIALTDSDEQNVLLSLLAKTNDIPIVITKVHREANRKLLSAVTVGTALSADRMASVLLTKFARDLSVSDSRSKIRKLYNIDDKAEAVTFVVSDNERIVNHKVRDIPFKENILCACVIRDGEAIIPNGETDILEGDLILVATCDFKLFTIEDALI